MALPVSLDSKSTALWTWTLAPPPDFLPLPFPPFFIFAGPARSDHSSATAFLPSVASPPPRSASAALATSFPHDARAFWRSEGRDRSQGQGRRRALKVESNAYLFDVVWAFPLEDVLEGSLRALAWGARSGTRAPLRPRLRTHDRVPLVQPHPPPRSTEPFPPFPPGVSEVLSFFLFFWWTFPGGN